MATTGERVAEVYRRIWQGNQTQMAKDLGVSQATVWRIVSGIGEPSEKFLAILEQHPEVDARWLREGVGDPPGPIDQRFSLPVTDRLLPGLPSDHDELLGSYEMRVPGPWFSPTRYFYQVPAGQVPAWVSSAVSARDYLLMEADNDTIPLKLDPGRIVAKFDGKILLDQLAVVDGEIGFSSLQPASAYVGTRNVMIDGEPKPSRRKKKTAGRKIISQIVAVCLMRFQFDPGVETA